MPRLSIVATAIGFILAGTSAASAASDVPRMMGLLERWIGGQYSTQTQFDADQKGNKPEAEKHRLMYQLFQKVRLRGFDGLIFFEQGSMEGTTDPEQIWRAGFLQFLPDEKLGVVRQRELHLKDPKVLYNAHLDPEKFGAITRDMVEWDERCDFLLGLNSTGTEIAGPIPEKACKKQNPGNGRWMYADDRIVVRDGEFWFLGRYRDEDGRIIWGNESGELNKLVRTTVAQ